MSEEKKSKKDKNKLSWRQQKRRHRLYYKVIHQSPRPHAFIYGMEVFFAIIVEIFRVALVFLRNLIVAGVVLGGIAAVVLFFKVYPTFDELLLQSIKKISVSMSPVKYLVQVVSY